MKWMPGVQAKSLRPGDCLEMTGPDGESTGLDPIRWIEDGEDDYVRLYLSNYLMDRKLGEGEVVIEGVIEVSGELMIPIWRPESVFEAEVATGHGLTTEGR